MRWYFGLNLLVEVVDNFFESFGTSSRVDLSYNFKKRRGREAIVAWIQVFDFEFGLYI